MQRQTGAFPFNRQPVQKPYQAGRYQPQPYGQQRRPGLGQQMKQYFTGTGRPGTGALFGLSANQPGAMYKARQQVMVMERQALQQLMAKLTELISLLGADQAEKILHHTKRSVLHQLDRMCLRKGWALFDEVAKTCVPIVGAFATAPGQRQQQQNRGQQRQQPGLSNFGGQNRFQRQPVPRQSLPPLF